MFSCFAHDLAMEALWMMHMQMQMNMIMIMIMMIPAEGKPRERFDWLLPGESQSPVIYNIKCSSAQFG